MSKSKELDVSDLLPDRFVTHPHKPLLVLAIDNPKYNIYPSDTDSKEPELLDSFIIKADLPNEIKHDGSKKECKILLYDNIGSLNEELANNGPKILLNWIRDSFEGFSGRSYLHTIKLHIKFLDQIGTVIKTETLYNCICVNADFDFQEYADTAPNIVLTIQYQ